MKIDELLAPPEYASGSFYSESDAKRYQREMEEAGWEMSQLNSKRSGGIFISIGYVRQYPRDANGFTDDDYHRDIEINLLKAVKAWSEGAEDFSVTCYKYAEDVLYNRGWVTIDMALTETGFTALATHN